MVNIKQSPLTREELEWIEHDVIALHNAVYQLDNTLRRYRLGAPNLNRIATMKGITGAISNWWDTFFKEQVNGSENQE